MKIYHISTKENLAEIRRSGVIKATPQLVHTYDDFGQEDFEWQNRAYFCLSRDHARVAKSALENHYNVVYEIGEFKADDDMTYCPDPNFREVGYYSKKDIEIQES